HDPGHKRLPNLLAASFGRHVVIFNDAILSPSRSKTYRRSTGLPGKSPVSRLVTTVFPPCSSEAMGLLVYLYRVVADSFHRLIALRPVYVLFSSTTTPSSVKHSATAFASARSVAKYLAIGFGNCPFILTPDPLSVTVLGGHRGQLRFTSH